MLARYRWCEEQSWKVESSMCIGESRGTGTRRKPRELNLVDQVELPCCKRRKAPTQPHFEVKDLNIVDGIEVTH
jgi:hypothetical protein